MVRRRLPGEQLTLRFRGNRGSLQLLCPWIDQPCAIPMSGAGREEESEVTPVACVGCYPCRNAPDVLLVLKLSRIDSDRIIEMLKKASRDRREPQGPAPAPNQTLPIHFELVALRFSAEDGMIFENKAGLFCTRHAVIEKRCRKAADASA